MAPKHLGLARRHRRALLENRVLLPVLAVRPHQREDQHGHDDHDDPRALRELRDGEDDDHDGANQGGDGVDPHPFAPMLVPMSPVVRHHA